MARDKELDVFIRKLLKIYRCLSARERDVFKDWQHAIVMFLDETPLEDDEPVVAFYRKLSELFELLDQSRSYKRKYHNELFDKDLKGIFGRLDKM